MTRYDTDNAEALAEGYRVALDVIRICNERGQEAGIACPVCFRVADAALNPKPSPTLRTLGQHGELPCICADGEACLADCPIQDCHEDRGDGPTGGEA